jgi:BMFP domain-containing protein YqiC
MRDSVRFGYGDLIMMTKEFEELKKAILRTQAEFLKLQERVEALENEKRQSTAS